MEILIETLVREERTRFVDEVPWKFSYGTAGFRDRAERLDRVIFRVGVLAALRSKAVGGDCTLMISWLYLYILDILIVLQLQSGWLLLLHTIPLRYI